MTTNRADSTAKDVRVLTYKIVNDKKYFLIVQESNDTFTLPGSYRVVEDTSLRKAAMRALHNSVGLTERSYSLKKTNLTLEAPDIYTDPNSGRKKDVSAYLFVAHYNSEEEMIFSQNLKRVLWLDGDEAVRLLTQEHVKNLFIYGESYCD
jgi:hypothetical protein